MSISFSVSHNLSLSFFFTHFLLCQITLFLTVNNSLPHYLSLSRSLSIFLPRYIEIHYHSTLVIYLGTEQRYLTENLHFSTPPFFSRQKLPFAKALSRFQFCSRLGNSCGQLGDSQKKRRRSNQFELQMEAHK